MTKTRKPRGRATLKWDRKNKQWMLVGSYRNSGDPFEATETGVFVYPGLNKAVALRCAGADLRADGRRWELTIYNKNGRIAKGGGGKRTYGGGDPERSKG